jgi:hypothetical protein
VRLCYTVCFSQAYALPASREADQCSENWCPELSTPDPAEDLSSITLIRLMQVGVMIQRAWISSLASPVGTGEDQRMCRPEEVALLAGSASLSEIQ